ncbi:unnamed protein product [Rotaria magnacalcarata]|uniref:Reverse transcriptase domain-containing protein n=1 Tax=Rotaria magnacalcarata TaxID=392030 RepID=A0A8S3DRN8_9BILA|nr:unnamed protein product [Rotaria magnacalcarata]
MGSSLAPLLAQIFLQEFETKSAALFAELGIIYWKRYVDDTFVLVNSTHSTKAICAELSKCHPFLQFTSEEEHPVTHTLPFIGVLIKRQPGTGFNTSIYRKPTFSGLMTKWSSFVPKTYKHNAVFTLIYRAIQLCSSKKSLYKELNFIRQLATNNGYPIVFVNSVIRRQLHIKNSSPVPIQPELNNDIVVLRVPYFGPESQVYGKRVTDVVAKQYPLKKVRVIYDITNRIGQGFKLKDSITDEFKAGVVYEATCSQCNKAYVGQTFRHLKTRVHEHMLDQKKFIPQTVTKTEPKKEKKHLPQKPKFPHDGPITRSKTGKLPPAILRLNQVDIDLLLDQTTLKKEKNEDIQLPKSAISKHYIATSHIITKQDFKILITEPRKYRLRIKESLMIIAKKPKLNGNDRSMPLYIYPDGIEITKEKEKKTIESIGSTTNLQQANQIKQLLMKINNKFFYSIFHSNITSTIHSIQSPPFPLKPRNFSKKNNIQQHESLLTLRKHPTDHNYTMHPNNPIEYLLFTF